MTERVAPSARIEVEIERPLASMDDPEGLAELGRLGARLVLKRALEEEVTAFLGRARYVRDVRLGGCGTGTVDGGYRRPRAS